jgi:carbon starvation protein
MRFLKLPLWLATVIFLPLVAVAIWYGQQVPLTLPALGGSQVRTWDYLILVYCGIASVLPVWALLQPRGYLGGFFLYSVLAAALLGILFGGGTIAGAISAAPHVRTPTVTEDQHVGDCSETSCHRIVLI